MRRLPVLPTLVVALAVAAMVALGCWQLRRAAWKEALLATCAANAQRPPVALPLRGALEPQIYRRATALCRGPISWSTRAGQNRAGEGGWRHVALCAGGIVVDMGWSRAIAPPQGFAGGLVTGVLDADRDHGVMLVSDHAVSGAVPSRVPTPADLPNNHLAYAVQWFAFAGVAVVIFGLALRRRWRQKLAEDGAAG